MNGMDAWKGLKEGLIVTLRGKGVGLGDDGNIYTEFGGRWIPVSLETIMTSNDFMVKFPEKLPSLPEVE